MSATEAAVSKAYLNGQFQDRIDCFILKVAIVFNTCSMPIFQTLYILILSMYTSQSGHDLFMRLHFNVQFDKSFHRRQHPNRLLERQYPGVYRCRNHNEHSVLRGGQCFIFKDYVQCSQFNSIDKHALHLRMQAVNPVLFQLFEMRKHNISFMYKKLFACLLL